MSSSRVRRSSVALVVLGLAGAQLAACRQGDATPEVEAHFGVFFGGQLEEREKVPLIVDRTRQTIGIRLEFASPPRAEQSVRWELEKPAPGKSNDGAHIVAYGEAKTRVGEPVLDVPLAFESSDRPGPWRVRVALDGKRVLDRPFTVTPANEAPTEN